MEGFQTQDFAKKDDDMTQYADQKRAPRTHRIKFSAMRNGHTLRRADICHCPPSNGGVDLVRGGSRVRVECNHYDFNVRYDGGRSKEVLEPMSSVRHTSIVAVILDVGL
jgi:hypothetical protein